MISPVFVGSTWEAYEELRQKDKKLHDVLFRLLKEMLRDDPNTGTGKPEPLKHILSGLWSRRLSLKDRIIYKFDSEHLYLIAIGGHYDRFDCPNVLRSSIRSNQSNCSQPHRFPVSVGA